MKTPITREALRTHWTYSWWKYTLVAVLVWAGFSLLYTVTAPRPAPEKVVNMFLFGVGDDHQLQTYMDTVRQNEMPDMEEMEVVLMPVDDSYTAMQLTTYIAAGEGDVYVLPKDYFQNYAKQGAFIPLESSEELTEAMAAHGLSADRGWVAEEDSGERHMYGIAVNQMPGFKALLYGSEDMYLCISVNSGNNENCIRFLTLLIRDSAAKGGAVTGDGAVRMFVFGEGNAQQLTNYMATLQITDMPEMTVMDVTFVPAEEASTNEELMRCLTSGDGDVLVLSEDLFRNLAGKGMLAPLEGSIALTEQLEAHGLIATPGFCNEAATGERHLYGLPVDQLPVFAAQLKGEGLFVCVSANSGNEENCIRFLSMLVRDGAAAQ